MKDSTDMDLVIKHFNQCHYGPATKELNIACCALITLELKLAWRHNKAEADRNYQLQRVIWDSLFVRKKAVRIYTSRYYTATVTYDVGRPGSLLRVSDGVKQPCNDATIARTRDALVLRIIVT
jgi:hypothetical protein